MKANAKTFLVSAESLVYHAAHTPRLHAGHLS
jgi:hypothetical protein